MGVRGQTYYIAKSDARKFELSKQRNKIRRGWGWGGGLVRLGMWGGVRGRLIMLPSQMPGKYELSKQKNKIIKL